MGRQSVLQCRCALAEATRASFGPFPAPPLLTHHRPPSSPHRARGNGVALANSNAQATGTGAVALSNANAQ